jgi:hypothetical protein
VSVLCRSVLSKRVCLAEGERDGGVSRGQRRHKRGVTTVARGRVVADGGGRMPVGSQITGNPW